VDLLFGGTVVTQFPLNFHGQKTLGPLINDEFLAITFSPGCVFMDSKHSHDRIYLP
jgi:hypothetical protein